MNNDLVLIPREALTLLRDIANAAADFVFYNVAGYDDLCDALMAGQTYLEKHDLAWTELVNE